MRTSLLMVSVAILTLGFSSCNSAPEPDLTTEENAIRAADEQWSAAAGKNDLDGTVAFYSDGAVLLPPNAPLMQGKKAIRDAWAGLIGPNVSLSWKPTKIELAKSGELGYLYGTYQDSVKDPKGGPPVSDTGKIVEIWKKQADGKWKCIVDTYNSDLPLPATK
jgi:ketosteroid isomerase-like protein